MIVGLKCSPEGSMYYECVSDFIKWHKQDSDYCQKTWELINEKYQENPENRKFSCSGPKEDFNIDAKINGAYIVTGLLYGERDIDKTIIISTRCGQDSDCNPSNAAGILFTSIGYSKLPDRFKSEIDNETKFSYTEYNFPRLINVCETLVKQAVVNAGGRIENNSEGTEELVIPVVQPIPEALEQCWEASETPENVNFTKKEMEQIKFKARSIKEFVTCWQYTGPYTKEGVAETDLINEVFPPEEKSGKVDWKEYPFGEEGYSANIIELDKVIGGHNRIAYLKNEIWCPENRKAIMEIGSDDGIKIWLSGKLIHENNIFRGCSPGEDKVEIELKKGWNDCLMKITQGTGGWQAAMVITDLEGNTLKDLKFK